MHVHAMSWAAIMCVSLCTLQAACFASLTLSEGASKSQKQLQQPLPVGTLRGG